MELREILVLLQHNEMKIDEAIRLIEKKKEQKILKITVQTTENGEPVNLKVNLPFVVAKVVYNQGIKIGDIDLSERINIEDIQELINNGVSGEVCNFDTSKSRVKIYID